MAEIKQTQAPGTPNNVDALKIKQSGVDTSKFEKASAKAYKDSITNWDYYAKNEWKRQSSEAIADFGNNPAQLQKALQKIRTEMLPDDTPTAIRNQFMDDTYYDCISIMNKANTDYKTRQRKETKANAGLYADGLTDDIATSFFNVLTYNTATPEEKRPADVEVYVKQRADLSKLADLKDDDGNFYFSESQRKNMKNPEDSMLEGFKQFFDGMLLNDNDDLENSKNYYTKFMLAPERFMADNGMSRNLYDKARAYAEKELKRAGADLKNARFNQSVNDYLALQIEDKPEKIESLRQSGMLSKNMIDQMEKVNVKFNEIDPSKTESPAVMLDLLEIVNSFDASSGIKTEDERALVLAQGTAALDAVAEYGIKYGLSPKKLDQVRRMIVLKEQDKAFSDVLSNFGEVTQSFGTQIPKMQEKLNYIRGAEKNIFKAVIPNRKETRKLVALNDALVETSDAVSEAIRNNDTQAYNDALYNFRVKVAQIKYSDSIEDYQWAVWAKDPDYEFSTKDGAYTFKISGFTPDGDIIIKE